MSVILSVDNAFIYTAKVFMVQSRFISNICFSSSRTGTCNTSLYIGHLQLNHLIFNNLKHMCLVHALQLGTGRPNYQKPSEMSSFQ